MAVHALGQLVEEVREKRHMSLRELSRRAGLSSSSISKLLRVPMEEMPKPSTIRGLARALGVPEWRVVDACLRSVNLPSVNEQFRDGSTVAEMRRILETSQVLTADEREMWEFFISKLERRIENERRDDQNR